MRSEVEGSAKAKKAAQRATAKNRANIAEDMTEDERKWLADRLFAQYSHDSSTLEDWVSSLAKAYLLTNVEPTRTAKELPWPGAANVVVPLIASACLQASSRAYAAHFEQGYPRRVSLLPTEPGDIESADRADRCLNWQLISDMPDYESEWDLAFNDWPIFGNIHKKVTWNHDEERPESCYVPSTDVKIAAGVRRVTSETRVSQLYEVDSEEFGAEVDDGFFLDGAKPAPSMSSSPETTLALQQEHAKITGQADSVMSSADEVKPYKLVEVQFFGRIFSDDAEPSYYKAILDATTKQLLRLTSRKVRFSGKIHVIDELLGIPFIPDPRSGYGRGFGQLLTPLNEMVNTLFNLFIDAGALANMPVLKESRTASLELVNGVWKPGARLKVNDLSQIEAMKLTGLGPELPILINYLTGFSRDISSVSEEMTGRAQEGVRDPTVRGTFARLEQGLTQLSTIIRRSTRQQKQEIGYIIKLNQLFLPKKKQFRVLGETKEAFLTSGREDFGKKLDVIVAADPAFASPQMRRGEVLSLADISLRFPLVSGVPQMGIAPNVPIQTELLREVYRTFGRIDLMGHLPEAPPARQPPSVENQRILEGAPVTAKQGEDHLAHSLDHLKAMELAENEAQANAFRVHVNEHLVMHKLEQEQALQALQQQQAAAPQPAAGEPNGEAIGDDATGAGGNGIGAPAPNGATPPI